MEDSVVVRQMINSDYSWVKEKVEKCERKVKSFQIKKTNGYIAQKNKELVGVALLEFKNNECEILFLESFSKGVGTILLETIKEKSKKMNCKNVWRILSKDNPALDFYKAKGFIKKDKHNHENIEKIEILL